MEQINAGIKNKKTKVVTVVLHFLVVMSVVGFPHTEVVPLH